MLTALTIKNLKCFGDQSDIPLAPMTLIYGENSSGKSTILLALQRLRRQILADRHSCHASFPYKGWVTGHDTSLDISIGVEARGVPPKADGFALSRYTEFPAKAIVSWSYGKQKPELKTLDILKSGGDEEFPEVLKWRFKRDGADMVAPASPYLAGRMINIMCDNKPAILEGIERHIEADIMRDFLKANPEEHKLFYTNYMISMHGTEVAPSYSELMRSEREDSFEPIRNRQAASEAAKAQAKAIAQEWRKDLPAWIKECPPSWRTYRESQEFKAKAELLRATTYRDIVDFCETGNPEYFKKAQARLWLRDGLLNQREEYERSVVFTRDTLGLRDLHLHISPSMDDKEKLDVDLIPNDKGDGKFEEVFQQGERLEREDPGNFKEVASVVVEPLRQIVVIAPLRQPAQRDYSSVSTPHDTEESDVGGSKVPLMLKGDELLRTRVNEWLARLGVDYAVEIQSINEERFELLLRDTRNPEGPLAQYADVGFGISQILPILVACLSDRPSTILIEQPELHIHPRLQAELGSLFAEAIHTYHHQLIVETHSEHLMLRVQKLIRTGKSSPNDVCVLYVSRGDAGSSVQRLELNESAGFLEPWPNGFFPERLQELI